MNKLILFDGSSELIHYKVVDAKYNGRQARVLYSGGSTPQSGVALDDDPELLFDYNQRFLEIAESIHPKSILLIGGGVFTLPKALLERFHDIQIDAIEIDPLLPQLAKQYFDLTSDPRLNIVVGDGREYVNKCQVKYDLIIVDAFIKYEIPTSLLSVEAVREYNRCLNKNGVVAINFIGRYHTYKTSLTHRLVATFGSVFRTIELYPSNYRHEKRAEQNLILIASNQDTIALDYLQSTTVHLLFMPEAALLHDNE